MSNHFFFEKAKICTFKDVDCKKDHQEGPYLNHLGKKLTIAFKMPSLAAIVVCWRIQEESKFEIIAWSFTTDIMVHDTHGIYSKPLTKYNTFEASCCQN